MGDWTEERPCEVWLLRKLEAKARRGTAWGTQRTERAKDSWMVCWSRRQASEPPEEFGPDTRRSQALKASQLVPTGWRVEGGAGRLV